MILYIEVSAVSDYLQNVTSDGHIQVSVVSDYLQNVTSDGHIEVSVVSDYLQNVTSDGQILHAQSHLQMYMCMYLSIGLQ